MGLTAGNRMLSDFLASSDLDELLAAREALESVDEEDEQAVTDVLVTQGDEQAVANILMYPEVAPDDMRVPALLRGLRSTPDDYTALAAAVGVQHLADLGGLSHEQRATLAAALLSLLARADGLVADRAHVAVLALTRGASPEPLVLDALADGSLSAEQGDRVRAALARRLPALTALPSYREWRAGRA